MTTDLPVPPVAADCDLRDFQFMGLDVQRLRDSELASVANAEVFRVAVLSWCVSWHQVPAASLPDDDATLARMLGFGRDLRGWKRVRAAGGLRGWVRCSDGRLYHPVVAEKAADAAQRKADAKRRREADAERLRRYRETKDETRTQADVKRVSQRVGEGSDRIGSDRIGQGSDAPSPSPGNARPPAARGGARSRITGFDPEEVRNAVKSGDLLAVLSAFGAKTDAGREPEWRRDCAGEIIGTVAAVLWLNATERTPIREPSGWRAAWKRWQGTADGDRSEIVDEFIAQVLKPPAGPDRRRIEAGRA